jgi:hemerythrin-like domain-containing protein
MSQEIAQQTLVENDMLKLLMEGLRSTVAWKVQGNDFSRKLSTLRFIVRSFQGHLDRLFALEEYDGYMDLVEKKSPRLSRTVDALRMEHDRFRTGIRRIVHGLEQVSSTNQALFVKLCDELLVLLKELNEHCKRETDLFQEAFEQDRGGGEG